MSYQRIKASERNRVIAEYLEGKKDPVYDVIPNKNIKGKYTVRKRKEAVPAKEEPEPVKEDITIKEVAEEEEEAVEEEVPKPKPKLQRSNSDMNTILEYQMQLNKMMIEQMKALRQNNKYMMHKQKKYKERQGKIHNIFESIMKAPEKEPVKEPVEEEEEVHEQPKEEPKDYFDKGYKNNQPVKHVEPEVEVPEPEPKVYQNDYEAEVDNMAGYTNYVIPSRRDRIKSFI